MTSSLKELIRTQTPATPSDLSARVFAKVQQTAMKTYKRQQRLWTVFSLASLAACALTGWQAASAIASSNFGSYVSLFFSDGAIALASWREAGMSLLETLPVAGIGFFLASIALTLFLARRAVQVSERSGILSAHA